MYGTNTETKRRYLFDKVICQKVKVIHISEYGVSYNVKIKQPLSSFIGYIFIFGYIIHILSLL